MRPQRRIFFALWPDKATRAQIATVQHRLKNNDKMRLIAIDNLHVTLHFIGNIETAQLDCFIKAANKVRFKPFTIRLDSCGQFARSRVFWLGMTYVPDELIALYQILKRALNTCGFNPEPRPYKPHLTLARKLNNTIRLGDFKPIDWAIDGFYLVESISSKHGVRYQPLAGFTAHFNDRHESLK